MGGSSLTTARPLYLIRIGRLPSSIGAVRNASIVGLYHPSCEGMRRHRRLLGRFPPSSGLPGQTVSTHRKRVTWDRDPWLLNSPTGTIDLKTGQVRPHQRRDLITKGFCATFQGAHRFRYLLSRGKRTGRVLGPIRSGISEHSLDVGNEVLVASENPIEEFQPLWTGFPGGRRSLRPCPHSPRGEGSTWSPSP